MSCLPPMPAMSVMQSDNYTECQLPAQLSDAVQLRLPELP